MKGTHRWALLAAISAWAGSGAVPNAPLPMPEPGTVLSWGFNAYGQLGNQTTQTATAPVPVSFLKGIAALAAGGYHTLALHRNGVVVASGRNNRGQLGDNCPPIKCKESTFAVPVRVEGGGLLTDVVAIAAGQYHSLALTADGIVYAWGDNTSGQLGDGKKISRSFAKPVLSLSEVRAIAAGDLHSLAILADGSVRAWGDNSFGQLGDNSTTASAVPVATVGVTAMTRVSAGSGHSLAMRVDGTVWAWGRNTYGQVGDGTTTHRLHAVPVGTNTFGQQIVNVSAGRFHSLALKADGTAYSWGYNAQGQLGRITATVFEVSPAAIGLADVVTFSGGGQFSLAVKGDGSIWAWGHNGNGQLGIPALGSTITQKPQQVPGLDGITTVAAGRAHALAAAIPTIWTWGAQPSSPGTLGGGTWHGRATPGQLIGPTWPSAVAAGGFFNLALAPDSTVWSWGVNEKGQLGDGGGMFDGWPRSPTAVRVTTHPGSALAQVTAIAAGNAHALALGTGRVWGWGWNNFGQVGDGSTVDRTRAVAVGSLNGVTTIAAGGEFSLARRQDGTLWAWGSNGLGQLGIGVVPGFFPLPQHVSTLSGVTAMAAGDAHALAITNDGTLWAWGYGDDGQLGDGCAVGVDCTESWSPAPVAGLSDVVAVAGFVSGSMALKADSTVWVWGLNDYGQLGDGCTIGVSCASSSMPTQVFGLPPISAIGGGQRHRVAVASDGSIWAWGRNLSGELGNGLQSPGGSVPVKIHQPNKVMLAVGGFGTHSVAVFPLHP